MSPIANKSNKHASTVYPVQILVQLQGYVVNVYVYVCARVCESAEVAAHPAVTLMVKKVNAKCPMVEDPGGTLGANLQAWYIQQVTSPA